MPCLVAYREMQRFSVPQLGYLGYRITCNRIIHDWLHRLQRGNSPLQKATDPSQDQNRAGITLVGAAGIEIASFPNKSLVVKGVAPLPCFQLVSNGVKIYSRAVETGGLEK
jgi:hypothetical protein